VRVELAQAVVYERADRRTRCAGRGQARAQACWPARRRSDRRTPPSQASL